MTKRRSLRRRRSFRSKSFAHSKSSAVIQTIVKGAVIVAAVPRAVAATVGAEKVAAIPRAATTIIIDPLATIGARASFCKVQGCLFAHQILSFLTKN